MTDSEHDDERTARAHRGVDRRTFLRAGATLGAGLAVPGLASATPGNGGRGGRGEQGGRGDGFPPEGITDWGDAVNLGDGQARTLTTATPSGNPKYHGVLFEEDAFSGLPSASDLENADDDEYADKYGLDGLATTIHRRWSQEFFVPFPDADTAVTFLGLNWNPEGHPGAGGAWGVPHFDVHFHFESPSTVDAITGSGEPNYELPAKYVPANYGRGPVAEERVVTDMGEHLADLTAPEFGGGEFASTLIWGVYDVDGDGIAEQTFVEPMLTREYLRDASGVDRRSIVEPETYVNAGTYPTSYCVRAVPSRDAVAVYVEAFEARDGDA